MDFLGKRWRKIPTLERFSRLHPPKSRPDSESAVDPVDPNCARPSPRIVSPSCHSNSNECKQRWCCFFFPWGRKMMHLKQSINQSFVWAVYRFHNSKCVSCSSVFVDVTFLFYICFGSTGLSKKGCLPNCLKARLGIMGPSTTIDCDLSSSAMALIMGNAAWSLSRG